MEFVGQGEEEQAISNSRLERKGVGHGRSRRDLETSKDFGFYSEGKGEPLKGFEQNRDLI